MQIEQIADNVKRLREQEQRSDAVTPQFMLSLQTINALVDLVGEMRDLLLEDFWSKSKIDCIGKSAPIAALKEKI